MSEYTILRLKNGIDVIGVLKGENDKGVDLSDACVICYGVGESGYPSILLHKYCQVSRDFDVFFSRETILNIFRDPIPAIVEYYQRSIIKMRERYTREYETVEYDEYDDPSTVDELMDQQDMLTAMAELYSANTTIQ